MYPVDIEPALFLRLDRQDHLPRCRTLASPLMEMSKSRWDVFLSFSVRHLDGASSTSKKFSITSSNLPEETPVIEAKQTLRAI